jgi:hypothetical protein
MLQLSSVKCSEDLEEILLCLKYEYYAKSFKLYVLH